MNKLSLERRAQIVSLLVECTGVNPITRITGVSVHTVLKLLADVGEACQQYQEQHLRDLNCRRIQCDEIWSFVGMKEKQARRKAERPENVGDVWTWTAIDADTKLVPCWHVGNRDAQAAMRFMRDVASRLANPIQLTTDGFHCYLDAVAAAFPNQIDYAMLVKMYGTDPSLEAQRRYSPSICLSAESRVICGNPDREHINTSYVERQNLTMCTHIKRFARLTNAHSKKLANHKHAVALHFMHYNFARICSTVRCSPAMQAGVSNHLWSMKEIAALAD
jgi:IS1 family transposase